MTAIPQHLGQIWIGPYDPPLVWMNTWRAKHPDWQYTVYDNDFLHSYNFKNRKLIDLYWQRQEYAGVADIMRYEILYEFGGIILGADSLCYHNTDEIWTRSCAYVVYENEFMRGKMVSPVYGCEPGNGFVKNLIDELQRLEPERAYSAWVSTGNLFVTKMIEKYQPDLVFLPSHYFIPVHYEGIVYDGPDKIYAKQLFGSTRRQYPKPASLPDRFREWTSKFTAKKLRRQAEQKRQAEIARLFEQDFSSHFPQERPL